MKIVFIVLAHQYPMIAKRLIEKILSDESFFVVLHYDLKAPESEFTCLKSSFDANNARIRFAERVDIRWGEWSMVEAALKSLRVAFNTGWDFDYVYLVSAADYPIRSFESLKHFLEKRKGTEFIESFDAEKKWWVAGGIQKERYELWHFFNWRSHPKLFSLALFVQKRLFVKRQLPEGQKAFIGSQWWVLTKETCHKIIQISEDKKIVKFYKRVWVPDEIYFQTLVRTIVPDERIATHSLTYYEFTDYGVPIVFCNDHIDHLAQQSFFFARKISNYANWLRDALDKFTTAETDAVNFDHNSVGRKTHHYQLKRLAGREGYFGKRKIGYVGDSWWGDIEWNINPYFVIYGYSSIYLKFFQSLFNKYDSVLCHGLLFNTSNIDFVNDDRKFCGFFRNDIKIRDHNDRSFFVQVLHEGSERTSGYLHKFSQRREIFDVHIWDPNATVFLIKEPPTISYIELHGEDDGSEIYLTNYFEYLKKISDDYELVESTLKQAGSDFCILDVKDLISNSTTLKALVEKSVNLDLGIAEFNSVELLVKSFAREIFNSHKDKYTNLTKAENYIERLANAKTARKRNVN